MTTPEVKSDEAEVNLQISIANNGLDSVEVKVKIKFSQILSKSREINLLSAARMFLFGSRDIWFVV